MTGSSSSASSSSSRSASPEAFALARFGDREAPGASCVLVLLSPLCATTDCRLWVPLCRRSSAHIFVPSTRNLVVVGRAAIPLDGRRGKETVVMDALSPVLDGRILLPRVRIQLRVTLPRSSRSSLNPLRPLP
ncbi:hypothetical protein C8R45DRAFT_1096019 [Mycena sanguinolenta]|nr:hypothetical protein C8R45DRAFT_1096019 [Mycena sanguinolenta]